MSKAVLSVIAGALGALVLTALAGLAVIYAGAYNIAATEEHTSIIRWAFNKTLETSVRQRAEDVDPPESLTQEMIAAGSGDYKAMCQHCHGGVGADRSAWSRGMRPRPPLLREAVTHWKPSEVFWLVKHGAKMSGMPAFGPSHDDKSIWNIVAFAKALPSMTPQQYAELGKAHQAGSRADGHAH